ncbi:MAG: GNAT family N-acetyltransferase [Bacteroidetes bacterium]|nr:GNAT family N-acetyltransferase [Bacteroidota bacterium]
MSFTIKLAQAARDYEQARQLFIEYQQWLGFDLCFQNFDEELNELQTMYCLPEGGILLLVTDTGIAGCIALRKLSDGPGEIKRLFVRQEYRSSGYGRLLTEQIIELARKLGYRTLRLDTLDSMETAIKLYKDLGFKEIPQYRENPLDGARFFELVL